MAKYKYNPETISYDAVDSSFVKKIYRLMPHILGSFFIAVIIAVMFLYVFDSPKELALKRKNQQILANYQHLNQELNAIESALKDIQYRDDNIYRTVFEAEPIADEIRQAGFGGTDKYQELRQLDDHEIVANTSKRFDIVSKKMYIQSKSFDEVAKMAKNKEEMLASIPAIMPLALDKLTRIASMYGHRIDPIYKTRRMHHGMDFTARTGTPIYATGNGQVVETRRSNRGYGNKVIIDHGFGYKTLYAHMHTIGVKKGQVVKRGDIIGTVGNTGKSTGPHLHYEVHKNGHHTNPINFYFDDLTPAEYNEMIRQAMQPGGQSLD